MATVQELQEKLRQAEWLLKGAETEAQRYAWSGTVARWRLLIRRKFESDEAPAKPSATDPHTSSAS